MEPLSGSQDHQQGEEPGREEGHARERKDDADQVQMLGWRGVCALVMRLARNHFGGQDDRK